MNVEQFAFIRSLEEAKSISKLIETHYTSSAHVDFERFIQDFANLSSLHTSKILPKFKLQSLSTGSLNDAQINKIFQTAESVLFRSNSRHSQLYYPLHCSRDERMEFLDNFQKMHILMSGIITNSSLVNVFLCNLFANIHLPTSRSIYHFLKSLPIADRKAWINYIVNNSIPIDRRLNKLGCASQGDLIAGIELLKEEFMLLHLEQLAKQNSVESMVYTCLEVLYKSDQRLHSPEGRELIASLVEQPLEIIEIRYELLRILLEDRDKSFEEILSCHRQTLLDIPEHDNQIDLLMLLRLIPSQDRILALPSMAAMFDRITPENREVFTPIFRRIEFDIESSRIAYTLMLAVAQWKSFIHPTEQTADRLLQLIDGFDEASMNILDVTFRLSEGFSDPIEIHYVLNRLLYWIGAKPASFVNGKVPNEDVLAHILNNRAKWIEAKDVHSRIRIVSDLLKPCLDVEKR